MICERDSRREWDTLHPGAETKKKKKKKKNRKKYTRVQTVYFYRLFQVDVISKRENFLGYIGRQVNSLKGFNLSSFFSFPNPGEVNS